MDNFTPTPSAGGYKKIILVVVGVLVLAGLVLVVAKRDYILHSSWVYKMFNKKTADTVSDYNTPSATDESAPASPYASWYAFSTDAFTPDSSNDEKFAIFFPNFPDRSKDKIDASNQEREFDYYTYYTRDNSNNFYGVNVSYFPKIPAMTNPQANLQGALDAIIKSNSANSLLYSQKTTYGGYPALDYIIGQASLDATIKGRLIAVPERNVAYHLLYLYTGERGSEDDYAKFVGSLQIEN